MTVVHGNEGSVNVGANVVAKVTAFELEREAPISDTTAMGETSETHLAVAPKRWSGTLTCKRFRDDPGQVALVEGASVTLNLYGDGNASGQKYHTGTATVGSISRSQNFGDAVEESFSFTGNGDLTEMTVV